MTVPEFFNHYCRERLFEWIATLMLILLGLHIIQWPGAMGSSAFRFILQITGSLHLGIFFLMIGMLRIVALIANGSWPYWGPRVRALGAVLAALFWMQMDIALILLIPHVGTPPSPGIPVYFCLTLGELISAYRATARGERHGSA